MVTQVPSAVEIRRFKERLGMSVTEFAQLFHASPVLVYKWLDGTRTPNGTALLALMAGIEAARRWDEDQAKKAGRKLAGLLVGAGAVAAFLYLLGAGGKRADRT